MNERCGWVDDAFEDEHRCPNQGAVIITSQNYRAIACLDHVGEMLSDNADHLITRIEPKTDARNA